MTSKVAANFLKSILHPSRVVTPSLLRPYPRLPRTLQSTTALRFAHAIPKPSPSPSPSPPDQPAKSQKDDKTRVQLEPHYQITFTCVPCDTRSSHTISKQGYHQGSVLIKCPNCQNRHVISDHLNIFGDRKITVEDLMREKGQLVKRGNLNEEGDVEFWDDDTRTERETDERKTDERKPDTTESSNTQALHPPSETSTVTEKELGSGVTPLGDVAPQATSTQAPSSNPLTPAGKRPSAAPTLPGDIPSSKREYTTGSLKEEEPLGQGRFNGQIRKLLSPASRDELENLREALRSTEGFEVPQDTLDPETPRDERTASNEKWSISDTRPENEVEIGSVSPNDRPFTLRKVLVSNESPEGESESIADSIRPFMPPAIRKVSPLVIRKVAAPNTVLENSSEPDKELARRHKRFSNAMAAFHRRRARSEYLRERDGIVRSPLTKSPAEEHASYVAFRFGVKENTDSSTKEETGTDRPLFTKIAADPMSGKPNWRNPMARLPRGQVEDVKGSQPNVSEPYYKAGVRRVDAPVSAREVTAPLPVRFLNSTPRFTSVRLVSSYGDQNPETFGDGTAEPEATAQEGERENLVRFLGIPRRDGRSQRYRDDSGNLTIRQRESGEIAELSPFARHERASIYPSPASSSARTGAKTRRRRRMMLEVEREKEERVTRTQGMRKGRDKRDEKLLDLYARATQSDTVADETMSRSFRLMIEQTAVKDKPLGPAQF
ncbi:hypothetical protein F4778DRAFT_716043 [Xylariomycetidae sp. FL2044]|nr:hypothetical protein F4778DRAFT_716043 [Xylariomycetidae sp. FL2044]